jgi:hypothetical protein
MTERGLPDRWARMGTLTSGADRPVSNILSLGFEWKSTFEEGVFRKNPIAADWSTRCHVRKYRAIRAPVTSNEPLMCIR